MQQHAGDEGVYIRSLGTRGKHGGLSHATREVVLAMDAAGFDIILVETAGVGQTELDILRLAQSICVILVPESGDSIQVMKAGLMEIADIFVINKNDRSGADVLLKELVTMIGLSPPQSQAGWNLPVIKTQANQDLGVTELIAQFQAHQDYLTSSGKRKIRTKEFLKNEVSDILHDRLNNSIYLAFETSSGEEVLQQLDLREIDPYLAADIISK
ncbi:unnamed protein product [Sphagnum tenellum]